jgi:predicted ester cyclase
MMTADAVTTEPLIHRYYAAFNERRIHDASAMFDLDAVLEHLPLGQTFRGPEAYVQLSAAWIQALPDARVTIERVARRGDTIAEVDLLTEGTHYGTLDLGTYGSFRPTGQRVALRVRELLEWRGGRIAYSSLSFDTHALIRQLTLVDYPQLTTHLDRIHTLRGELDDPRVDAERRRQVADEIGRELDAARFVVRPWFRR